MESEVYIPVFCKREKLHQIEKRNGLGVNTRWIHFLLAIRSKHLQCFDFRCTFSMDDMTEQERTGHHFTVKCLKGQLCNFFVTRPLFTLCLLRISNATRMVYIAKYHNGIVNFYTKES